MGETRKRGEKMDTEPEERGRGDDKGPWVLELSWGRFTNSGALLLLPGTQWDCSFLPPWTSGGHRTL